MLFFGGIRDKLGGHICPIGKGKYSLSSHVSATERVSQPKVYLAKIANLLYYS